MIKNIALVLSGAALATLLILGTGQAPQKYDFVEASEESAGTEDRVSEPELEVYIDVYRTMQSDHSLTIEDAIKPKNLSLAEFRDLERRVQNESSKVERVRKALLKHVQENSHFSESAGPPADRGEQAADEQEP